MKRSRIIVLVTLILTLSCYSLISTSFCQADTPSVVLQEDFNDEPDSATPSGWSTNRNDALYMIFRVSGDTDGFIRPICVSDNQGGSYIYGEKALDASVTSGNLTFDFGVRPAAAGSSTHELHVVLQDEEGNDVIVVMIKHYWSSSYFTLGLQSTQAGTHFTESMVHTITVTFQDMYLSLVVDNMTQLSGISYNGAAVDSLRIESTTETHGGTHFFDNFKVWSGTSASPPPPNFPFLPQFPPFFPPTPPLALALILAIIVIGAIVVCIVVSRISAKQWHEPARMEPRPIFRDPNLNRPFNYNSPRFCPSCGSRTLLDANFCPYCGENLR